MHLLASLMSGFADAGGGSARIYRRGTTTAATCYSDFKGQNVATSHTLDSRGRVQRYVNELVDVKVFDSTGNQVIETFTDGVNATAVEIRHAHITGTDYDTAQQALGNPSTVQLLLDKLYTSFGADDFKVMVSGSQRYLKDVIQGAGYYDVKGPSYGAKGDGTTDDTVAVAAAIAAAAAAGGGTVYFPPGTYRFAPGASGAAIAVSAANIRFLGAGARSSILKVYGSSSQQLLSLDTGATSFTAEALGFTEDSSGSSCILIYSHNSGTQGRFIDCAITKTQTSGNGILGFADLQFIGCELTHVLSSSGIFLTSSASPPGGTQIIGGKIVFPGGGFSVFCNAATGGYLDFSGVTISYTRASSSDTFLGAGVSGKVSMSGCRIYSAGGSLLLNGTGVQDTVLYESGCTFDANVSFVDAPYGSTVRDHRTKRTGGTGTTYTPDAVNYASHEVVTSGASFQWVNPFSGTKPSAADFTMPLYLRYKNISGGAITPTFDTQYKASAVSVANNSAQGWVFVYEPSLQCFVQVGTTVAYAS